jgi:hypothetical protein
MSDVIVLYRIGMDCDVVVMQFGQIHSYAIVFSGIQWVHSM